MQAGAAHGMKLQRTRPTRLDARSVKQLPARASSRVLTDSFHAKLSTYQTPLPQPGALLALRAIAAVLKRSCAERSDAQPKRSATPASSVTGGRSAAPSACSAIQMSLVRARISEGAPQLDPACRTHEQRTPSADQQHIYASTAHSQRSLAGLPDRSERQSCARTEAL